MVSLVLFKSMAPGFHSTHHLQSQEDPQSRIVGGKKDYEAMNHEIFMKYLVVSRWLFCFCSWYLHGTVCRNGIDLPHKITRACTKRWRAREVKSVELTEVSATPAGVTGAFPRAGEFREK